MKNILVPVDGSAMSDRAVAHVVATFPEAQVHLLHVEAEPTPWQTHGMEQEAILSHLHACSLEHLKSAHAILKASSTPHVVHTVLGDVAETIVAKAAELGCEAIVMGCSGKGMLAGLVLGSVARKVIHLTTLPVTLVK